MASILVIDDDSEMREMVAITLESAGYGVSQALGGIEGIRAARDSRFDLIVLDILMPDVDGIEVMMNLRHDNINTPVVLITGLRSDSELYNAATTCIGAIRVLGKPFKRDQLLKVVATILESKGAAQS